VIDASKAIVLLASDMGAISNVASASDFGNRITESAAKINDSICKVARHAEEISQFAMDTPAKSSDISALADKLASVIKETQSAHSRYAY
jgi:methyl-accepting chemotaxis protein